MAGSRKRKRLPRIPDPPRLPSDIEVFSGAVLLGSRQTWSSLVASIAFRPQALQVIVHDEDMTRAEAEAMKLLDTVVVPYLKKATGADLFLTWASSLYAEVSHADWLAFSFTCTVTVQARAVR